MSNRNSAIELCKQYSEGIREFRKIQLENVNLEKACLSKIDLEQANLNFANFQKADLCNSNFKKSSLIEANLSRADLSQADFSYADISQANLTGANLYATSFCHANLTRANLSVTRFSQKKSASTTKNKNSSNIANSTEVSFQHAILAGAFFIGVDLTIANLEGAIYDDRTVLPPNLDPAGRGMIHIRTMQEFAIDKLLAEFNHVYNHSNKYLGKTIAAKYFDSSRPKFDWLNQFKIDKSNQIVFNGTVSSFVTPQQLELFKTWINSFIKSCSIVITDFKKLI